MTAAMVYMLIGEALFFIAAIVAIPLNRPGR